MTARTSGSESATPSRGADQAVARETSANLEAQRDMLVRWQPLVFVSSSIRGLERSRDAIRREIEALKLADVWLFEFHGVASGSSAAHQYLQIARECDVSIVIVGDDVGLGTRDEYEVAIADNPNKVLPFLFGDAGPGSEAFRERLRRHRFRAVKDVDALPAAIGAAVHDYLTTGEIVRPALIESVKFRRSARRQFLGLPDGFAFRMALKDEEGTSLADTALAVPAARYVVSGPPGSGKTDLASGALVEAADGNGLLPLLLAASGQTPIEDWISEAFESVRFAPGPKLIDQYLRDGRVALAIDGIDDLGPDDRRAAFQEVARASRRYPRASVLLLSRLPHPPLPSGFRHGAVQPLTNPQLDALFATDGDLGIHTYGLDPRLLDLVRLPFWAALVVRYGGTAASALDLLDSVVGHRLADRNLEDTQGLVRIRAMLGALAFAIRPSDRVVLSEALELIAQWLDSDSGRRRFGGASADGLLEQGRRTGIVNLEGLHLRFPHPLVAAYLAAEHVVAERRTPEASADDGLFAFVAALSHEDARGLAPEILARCSIFAVATFLRLVGEVSRPSNAHDDLARLDASYRKMAPLIRADPAEHLSVLMTGGYTCFRTTQEVDGPQLVKDVPPQAWVAPPISGQTTATCWRGNPLERATPEQLAAQLILNGFKRAWERLRPEGDAFGPPERQLAEMISDPAMSDRLIAFALRGRETRRRLLGEIGLTASHLDNTPGEPHITVRVTTDSAYFTVEWDADSPVVERLEDGEILGVSIDQSVADPDAAAYADLQKDLESSLGSAISTQAIRRPSAPWAL